MPTLNFTVSERIAEQLRREAEAKGLSVSKFVSEIIEREVMEDAWPAGFFTEVAGSWQGSILEIEDFELQERDELL